MTCICIYRRVEHMMGSGVGGDFIVTRLNHLEYNIKFSAETNILIDHMVPDARIQNIEDKIQEQVRWVK